MLSPQQILQQFWGHDSFRPVQESIIESVIEEKDTLALLPTGGGKSICFQVPALMLDGTCLVISPLLALMKDQVMNLEKKGISALALHSGMTYYELETALQKASHGHYKFLYLSPERLESKLFLEYLPALQISLIAVDEAHCISHWGYDFRPPYLRIASLRNELPRVPVLALTASATSVVQQDIIDKLQMRDVGLFKQSFARPNLSYSVFNVESKINKILEILNNVPGSSIVYCKSRKLTKEVSGLLKLQGISADFYHAGLTQEQRNQKQEAWLSFQTRVMVCTNAFGMGIDKPDVRTVIHYNVPDCLENYYQEAGRAGRDGKKAYAVLLYQAKDITELEALPDERFPSVLEIRKVYQHLADYLQIPVGVGQGGYYDFDFNTFIKNFHLPVTTVINVLKVLEQEGHLSFNENIYLPSKLSFKTDKDLLNQFENSQPHLEPLIKCLLRTYEGIFDNKVSIFEKQISKITRIPEAQVVEQLKQLQAFGIVEYLPHKEVPQIHYILNRAPANFLYIDHEFYLRRKKQFQERIAIMLKYADIKKECRSKFIGAYFGDTDLLNCGICDNCLQQKDMSLTGKEFDQVTESIYKIIPPQGVPIAALIQQVKHIRKEKVWQVLNYLQNERRLLVDDMGIIRKK